MLAEAFRSHRGALSASLMETYGIRLEAHDLSLLELADLTYWIPDGSALWRAVGGPRAVSQEAELLVAVEYQIRHLQWMQQGKRNAKKPKPIELPKYASDVAAEANKSAAKGDRWRARQKPE